MGEFVEAIIKLREEIEELEREKMTLLEKIENPRAESKEGVNKLRDELDTLRKEVTAAETSVVTRTTDVLLRVSIMLRKE